MRMRCWLIFFLHNFKGIYILILGKAYCTWDIGVGDNRQTFSNEEIYLKNQEYFVGNRDDDERVFVMQPRTYEYPFQCKLPATSPTSFEGEFGYIRYTATVYLDRVMWPDQIFEEPITVINASLNNVDISSPVVPLELEEKMSFPFVCIFWCYMSKPVTLYGQTDRSVYFPGETIKLAFKAKNESTQNIKYFKIAFIQQITYCTKNTTQRIEKKVVQEHDINLRCDKGKHVEHKTDILLPPLPASDSITSNVCKIKYYIKIKSKVSTYYISPTLYIPIVIAYNLPHTNDLSQNSEDIIFKDGITTSKISDKLFTPKYPVNS